MEQLEHVFVIMYCVFIGLFLNEAWFYKNRFKQRDAWNEKLFHASYIGYKLKQILKIVLPVMTILVLISIYF